jgi:hypothetical protein
MLMQVGRRVTAVPSSNKFHLNWLLAPLSTSRNSEKNFHSKMLIHEAHRVEFASNITARYLPSDITDEVLS